MKRRRFIWSGQVRPGEVRSGQAMQDYLDLKIHVQHSACHTKATYQTSCQSVHRAQSNHRRYTNRLMAFNHFRCLPVETGISRSFKVPAILFGTLYGDVLPMTCAKYCKFWRRKKVLIRVFFHFDLQRSEVIQWSWHFHDLYIDGWTLNTILVVVLSVWISLEQKLQSVQCYNKRGKIVTFDGVF